MSGLTLNPLLRPSGSPPISLPRKEPKPLSKIQLFFADIRRSWEYNKIARITPIASMAGTALVQTAQLANNILNIVPPEGDGQTEPSGLSLTSPSALRIAGGFKIASGGIVGIASIYNIASEIIEIKNEVKKGRRWEGLDAGLRLTEAVANLGESVSSFAQGLALVNNNIGAVSWAPPLAIASAALSLVTVPINISGIVRAKTTDKKLTQPEAAALEYLKNELLDSEKKDGDEFLKRNFEIINREKYGAQILHIINSNPQNEDPAIPAEKRATAKNEMLQALRNRLSDKIKSHHVAIAAALVSVIGVMILFCPFLGPIAMGFGLALLGASSVLSLTKWGLEYRSVSRLEKKLDELCHFDKIPTSKLPAFAKPLRRKQVQPLAVDLAEFEKVKKASVSHTLPVRKLEF